MTDSGDNQWLLDFADFVNAKVRHDLQAASHCWCCTSHTLAFMSIMRLRQLVSLSPRSRSLMKYRPARILAYMHCRVQPGRTRQCQQLAGCGGATMRTAGILVASSGTTGASLTG